MPKYLVETVSIFRIRYVVEANDPTHAADEVVANAGSLNDGSLHEFSQKHLDETISSVREIDNAQYLLQFDEDNDYLSGWTDEQKFNFVNVVDYD